MRNLLIVAVAALVNASAAAEPVLAPQRRLTVVFVDVERALSPLAASSLRDEAVRSLRGAGVELEWLRAEAREIFDGTTYKLLLVRRAPGGLRLRCAMGSVISGPDAPRAAWLYLDSVLTTLRLPADLERLGLAQARDLGLALGKVAAHELVHAVAPELPHARAGLMAAQMGRTMLTSTALPIDAATLAALRPLAPTAAALVAAPSAAY
ncbi:MAG: hypothetical protein NDJ94_08400 [Vicinamibacteria bacterium]|jgi:hypothetical protein|nr:hypothetical protein [Vicinamibacteria bacterium]